MDKIDINNLNINRVLNSSSNTKIYLLDDGRVFKRLSPLSIRNINRSGVSLEHRLETKNLLIGIEGLVLPEEKVYEKEECIGYTMKRINGDTIYTYTEKIRKKDLEFYHELFKKLERIIRSSNEKEASFPDLLTLGNILVKKGNIYLIDYEGIDIEYSSIAISPCLEPLEVILDPDNKFYKKYFMFTKELDKYSLLLLYLRLVFNLSYSRINNYLTNPNGKEELYSLLNISDRSLQHMISKTLSPTEYGFYISDIEEIIRSKYDIDKKDGHNRLVLKK